MKPLDPRLLRVAAPARRYVVLTTILGIITAALIVAQCLLIAHILAPVIDRTADLADVANLVGWLAAVLTARVCVNYLGERFGQHAGVSVVADLREKVVARAVSLGPRWLDRGHSAETITLVTRGLDDLQPYLTRYLPQLFLAATVTPAALLVVLWQDWVAAAIIAGTLPLVPLFMWLVGLLTQSATERRQATMRRLGAQVLDLIGGIPTLRALHRERGPVRRVQQLSDAYRRSTMGTLRIAFLSGLVLELLTTLSVALVAVAVGMRLVHGGLDLTTGLAVIMLAPEVYLPVRQIGTHFHASADGIAAASRAFEILESPAPDAAAAARISSLDVSAETSSRNAATLDAPRPRGRSAPDMGSSIINLTNVGVAIPGSPTGECAPTHLTCTLRPGTITALAGPNGAGKTTAIQVLLGLISPTVGAITVTGADGSTTDLTDIDPGHWHRSIAWLPGRAWIWPGTIAQNVAATSAPADIGAMATRTGLDQVLADRDGLSTRVGSGGVGLSVGQRQRVALTRVLLADAPVVVLDEPTAHLDDTLAQTISDTLQSLRADGKTIVVVAHRPDLLAIADQVVEVRRG